MADSNNGQEPPTKHPPPATTKIKKKPASKNEPPREATTEKKKKENVDDKQKAQKVKKQKKKKLKRKKKKMQLRRNRTEDDLEQRYTIRRPDWGYFTLQMVFQPPYPKNQPAAPEYPPDALTWRSNISASLSQFLGVTGMAIAVDILSLGGSSDRNSVSTDHDLKISNVRASENEIRETGFEEEATALVRIPKMDMVRFSAAVAGWAAERDGRVVKVMVKRSSEFAMGVCGGNGGRDIFD